MSAKLTTVKDNADKLRARFHKVLMKANMERPRESDIEALRQTAERQQAIEALGSGHRHGRTG
jgi:hypothetical protein